MARVKISEFNAKTILNRELDIPWKGMVADKSTNVQDILKHFSDSPLVIKVDQGVKKRGKQGLVGVNFSPKQCVAFIIEKSRLGYNQFLIEQLVPHKAEEEHYLSIERVREGMKVLYSEKGGIEVEENWGSVQEYLVSNKGHASRITDHESTEKASLRAKQSNLIEALVTIMNQYHFSFLEINPLVILDSASAELFSRPTSSSTAGARRESLSARHLHSVILLDCAVLADDAGSRPYGSANAVIGLSEYPVEKRVRELDATTPASLKLKIVNPDGAIWMLLSGGGASLVLADEVADLGFGKKLGNYGEYSGSPSTEDTYLYTKAILQAMLASKSAKKALVIAGGVANFTDVAKTFKGIIQALDEVRVDLQKQKIKVFVRRGGPNQEKGLVLMRTFLEKNNLLGFVAGPELVLTEIVKKAISSLSLNGIASRRSQ